MSTLDSLRLKAATPEVAQRPHGEGSVRSRRWVCSLQVLRKGTGARPCWTSWALRQTTWTRKAAERRARPRTYDLAGPGYHKRFRGSSNDSWQEHLLRTGAAQVSRATQACKLATLALFSPRQLRFGAGFQGRGGGSGRVPGLGLS